jgi:hypothetical protein
MKKSAYNAAIWTACPSSLNFDDVPSGPPTEAMLEGYLFDWLATTGIDPETPGTVFYTDDCEKFNQTGGKYTAVADQEMLGNLNRLAELVASMNPVEDLKQRSVKDIRIDRLLKLEDGTSVLIDYKYGRTHVPAVRNAQLLTAALALGLKAAVLVIFQPRTPGGVRIWTATEEDLKSWERKIIWAEECAAQGGLLYLRADPDNCVKCRNNAVCPEFYAKMKEVNSYKTPLPDEALTDTLRWTEAAKKTWEKLREYAAEKITAGVEIPGFALEPSRVMRAYADSDPIPALTEYCDKHGIETDGLVITTIKSEPVSPAQFCTRYLGGKGSGAKIEEFNRALTKSIQGRPVVKRVYEPSEADRAEPPLEFPA